MNLAPLAEMHLLLREAGWEPEWDEEGHWKWSHATWPDTEFVTFVSETVCEEFYRKSDGVRHGSPEALAQRLQELSQK